MDEELRELEQAGQKAVNAVNKGMNITEESLQALLDVTGKVLGVAAKPVKKANDIEKERHAEKKAQKSAQKQTVSERFRQKKLENFYFTGKETDLCYFANTDRMPSSAFNNIPDPELRDKVYDTLDRMCAKKKGLIQIEGDGVVITEKGKKLLKDKNFMQNALNDQLEAYGKQFETMFSQAAEGQQQLGVVLNGDGVHDFAFFDKSDSLNLKQIAANPNANLRDKIVQNVKLWQQNGLVEIKDNVARITEKGRELLEQSSKLKEAAKGMKEAAVDGLKHTADGIVVTTKTAAKKVAEQAQKATQAATKAAANILTKVSPIK